MRLGKALRQTRIVRDVSDVQVTTRTPPTHQSRDTADHQARCSMDAMFTLSDSDISQVHIEPKFTRPQVSTCRQRISGDAQNNQNMRLMWVREKDYHFWDCAQQTNT